MKKRSAIEVRTAIKCARVEAAQALAQMDLALALFENFATPDMVEAVKALRMIANTERADSNYYRSIARSALVVMGVPLFASDAKEKRAKGSAERASTERSISSRASSK